MKKYTFILLLFVISLSGCNKFLEDNPSKTNNLPITKVEQLDALLGNFQLFYQDQMRHVTLCTEDWGLTPKLLNTVRSGTISLEIVQGATFDVKYMQRDGREDAWGSQYSKIFQANIVLKYIDGVSGDERKKKQLKAEAHFLKAYSYFLLAQIYCLPYTEETKNELGISIKNSVSFEEGLARVSLEETYKEIENQLNAALELDRAINEGGKYRPWRGNKSAVKAFAARYYLTIGNYNKALEYSNAALGEYSELVDYNTEMSFYKVEYPNIGGKPYTVNYPMTYRATGTENISHKEFYYTRVMYFPYSWYFPSEKLMSLYDRESDLRFKYHFVWGHGFSLSTNNPDYPGYVCQGAYNIPSGPTTSEMILVKAEAQARLGQWQDGLNTLETLRVKRIESAKYSRLVATDKESAIKLILKERRLEKPFVSTWFDARRYNINEVAFDDVNFSREFYPYNESAVRTDQALIMYDLKKGSKLWARPIPSTDIEASYGVIVQNKY